MENLPEGANLDVRGEGEGWIAWAHAGALNITIRSDDGETYKAFAIRDENVVSDMLASAKWVASLSDTEKDRALAAVNCLETANA